MPAKLKYFSYVSRGKTDQLYEQITDFAVEKESIKSSRGADASAEVGSSSILSVITGSLKLGGQYSHEREEVGTVTVIQKLTKVLEYIEKHEKVVDLGELCRSEGNVPLDAFCYEYRGSFYVLGEVDRRDRGVRINGQALDRLSAEDDDVLISKSLLLDPGHKENAYKEIGPNKSSLVSDFCIVASSVGRYTLELACSYKYFSDMGGSYHESAKEWDVYPHSGNRFFFAGETEAWFETLLFINGIKGKRIMGTPLFLVLGVDPNLRI